MSTETYLGDARTALDDARLPRGTAAVAVAASASVVAGAVHLAVVPEHLVGSWLHGSFFLAVALAQAALAWAVWHRPTVRVAVLGLGGTVGVVLLYVASRTVGLPVFAGAADGGGGHAAHSGQGGQPLVHQPIPGTIGPGVPVMPGLEGRVGVEGVGALDLVALAAELGLVVALLALLPARQRGVVANVLLGLGAALWAGALQLRGS